MDESESMVSKLIKVEVDLLHNQIRLTREDALFNKVGQLFIGELKGDPACHVIEKRKGRYFLVRQSWRVYPQPEPKLDDHEISPGEVQKLITQAYGVEVELRS